MDKEKILRIGNQLKGQVNHPNFWGSVAEIRNLISAYVGKNNSFYEAIDKVRITAPYSTDHLNTILEGFLRAVENDLISNVSYERKLKIEVVNDILDQAEQLLDKEEFHPATAAVLIGASLEEFLRNWGHEQNLIDDSKKTSIDTYAKSLRQQNLIDAQDYKEITAWGGLRNNAAHGKWDLVNNREKIKIMLQGVNLFIRKYSEKPSS